jgi:hypothetical protein
VEYVGPGYFCGGGYTIRLGRGERALVLPQGQALQATRLVLAGGEVNIWTGAPRAEGRAVLRYGGSAVTQQVDGGSIAYTISDETPYGLRLTSDRFRGFKATAGSSAGRISRQERMNGSAASPHEATDERSRGYRRSPERCSVIDWCGVRPCVL